MLNNNSSNKFNKQENQNNDLYVEDIYKDLYPTDNENQNNEETNNINKEPVLLSPKELKKQQKALKKAQKAEEKRRKIAEKERKKREKLALKMQKNNKYTSELVENIYAISDKREEKQYDENDEYIQPINLFDYYEDEDSHASANIEATNETENELTNESQPEINDELILDYPITPIEDKNKKPRTGFKKMDKKAKKENEEETSIAHSIEDTIYPIGEDVPTQLDIENQIAKFEKFKLENYEESKKYESDSLFKSDDIEPKKIQDDEIKFIYEEDQTDKQTSSMNQENIEEENNTEEIINEIPPKVIEPIVEPNEELIEEPIKPSIEKINDEQISKEINEKEETEKQDAQYQEIPNLTITNEEQINKIEDRMPTAEELDKEFPLELKTNQENIVKEEPIANELINPTEPEISIEAKQEETLPKEELKEIEEITEEQIANELINPTEPEVLIEEKQEEILSEEQKEVETIIEEPIINITNDDIDEDDDFEIFTKPLEIKEQLYKEIGKEELITNKLAESTEPDNIIEEKLSEEPKELESIIEKPEEVVEPEEIIEQSIQEEIKPIEPENIIQPEEVAKEPEIISEQIEEISNKPIIEGSIPNEVINPTEPEISIEAKQEEIIPKEPKELEPIIEKSEKVVEPEDIIEQPTPEETLPEEQSTKNELAEPKNIIDSTIYSKMKDYLISAHENKKNETEEPIEKENEEKTILSKENPIKEQIKKNKEEIEKSYDEITKQLAEFDNEKLQTEKNDEPLIIQDRKITEQPKITVEEKQYKPPFTTNPVVINNISSMEQTISEISKEKKQPEDFIIPKVSEALQIKETNKIQETEIKGIQPEPEIIFTIKPLKYNISEIIYRNKIYNSIEDDRLPLSKILYILSLRRENSRTEKLKDKPIQMTQISQNNLTNQVNIKSNPYKIEENTQELKMCMRCGTMNNKANKRCINCGFEI